MQFHSLTRPKHVAERINILFPALGHMQCQEWAARLLGYRNWYNLAGATAPDVQETPPFVLKIDENGGFTDTDESRSFFRAGAERQDLLQELIGREPPDIATLMYLVDVEGSHRGPRRLGSPGKGSASFRGMAWDVFSVPGEAPGHGGGYGMDLGLEHLGVSIYCGMPQDVDAQEFVGQLAAHIRRSRKKPYPRYDEVATAALVGGDFAQTSWAIEPLDGGDDVRLVSQARRLRLFVLKNDKPVGFFVTKLSCSASSDSDVLRLTAEVEEGWTSEDYQEVLDGVLMTIVNDVVEPLRRLVWFSVGNAAVRIEVEFVTESESQQTWYLVRNLDGVVSDALGDTGGGEMCDIVDYAVDICP